MDSRFRSTKVHVVLLKTAHTASRPPGPPYSSTCNVIHPAAAYRVWGRDVWYNEFATNYNGIL